MYYNRRFYFCSICNRSDLSSSDIIGHQPTAFLTVIIFAEKIRSHSQIPIIIVTSRNSDVDELMSMNLGAMIYHKTVPH